MQQKNACSENDQRGPSFQAFLDLKTILGEQHNYLFCKELTLNKMNMKILFMKSLDVWSLTPEH
jgi:hypothetical protein